MLYLEEETVRQTYNILKDVEYKNTNELFTLLVLKYSGLNQHEYLELSSESTKKKLLEATIMLSYLYVSIEHIKEKNSFINPLNMDAWGGNPKESIHIWSTQRLINNVTGGGRQWKSILVSDAENPNQVKLKHNYLDYFKNNLTSKIPLDALSIWSNKFTPFSNEFPMSRLMLEFNKLFNITEEEKNALFSTNSITGIKYASERIAPSVIRGLIGNPEGQEDWIEDKSEFEIAIEEDKDLFSSKYNTQFIFQTQNNLKHDDYHRLLGKANQVIFMGPPGTSKSYLANKISASFDRVLRVQFHPQYSYQDFIGGKVLENGTLKDRKGEFISFIEESIETTNVEKSYLLVIEEINRANVSQVFGEIIQLLDRGERLALTFNGVAKEYTLPKNLKIIGTMNTTDRTVGRLDYALKRRFYQVYCPPEIDVLIDQTKVEQNEFSIADLLLKINQNLVTALNNKEMVIGHAIFLKDFVFDNTEQKYVWSIQDFKELFYYVVIPIIEDYCNGNTDLILNILGEKLYSNSSNDQFISHIKAFLS